MRMSGRLFAGIVLAIGAVGLAALWASGGLAMLGWRVAAAQRAAQDALAGELAALRDGDAAARWGLLALCFGYGFLHAVGPGHGKALVAAATLGGRATAARMTLVAVVGSLAQAATAVALVFGGLALAGMSARSLTEGAERWLAPVGNLAMAAIGAWLVWRGIAGLRARESTHEHGCGCPTHAGAPDTPGGTLALVAAMAARPCAGAMFLLVIAWRMGWPAAGVAGVAAMGLGTAAFTALVAWLAATSRDAALLTAGSGSAARLAAPALALSAGGIVLALGALGFLAALAA
jgi:nickel/cobalt exporter